jgi:plasmid stabilization system protein ParE
MAFRVEIAPQAFDDLDRLAAYITAESSFAVAEKWFNEMMNAIASLGKLPARCPIAEESKELGREIRLFLHGRRNRTYKIYFAINTEKPGSGAVYVFHVRHWARRSVSSEDLRELLAAPRGGEPTG